MFDKCNWTKYLIDILKRNYISNSTCAATFVLIFFLTLIFYQLLCKLKKYFVNASWNVERKLLVFFRNLRSLWLLFSTMYVECRNEYIYIYSCFEQRRLSEILIIANVKRRKQLFRQPWSQQFGNLERFSHRINLAQVKWNFLSSIKKTVSELLPKLDKDIRLRILINQRNLKIPPLPNRRVWSL